MLTGTIFGFPHREAKLLPFTEPPGNRGSVQLDSGTGLLAIWTRTIGDTFPMRVLSPIPQPSSISYLLWDVERLEKADFVRPANHSRLSCMLAKALRSLTSRRMSCGGINLSPRFPIRTSDSLPKAALQSKPETFHIQHGKDWGGRYFLRHA